MAAIISANVNPEVICSGPSHYLKSNDVNVCIQLILSAANDKMACPNSIRTFTSSKHFLIGSNLSTAYISLRV